MAPFQLGWKTATGRPTSSKQDQFSALLLGQLPRLRRYAIALTGDIVLSDDLVQETAERALIRQDNLVDRARLYGWLRSILYNLYVDQIRQVRRRGPIVDIDHLADTIELCSPSADRNVIMDVTKAMNSLSPEHRQIILLVGLEGLSYREVSTELAIPVGTVMSRLARARDQLHERLNQVHSAPSGERR